MLAFTWRSHFDGVSDYSRRSAATAVIVLIMIIGGRVIPSFTRNWLTRENPGRLPVPFSRFDVAAILIGFAAMASWVIAPEANATGLAMVIASGVHFARLARWAGDRTVRDSLVFILHVSYFYVPFGFGLIAAAILSGGVVPHLAGTHALGVGAAGGMTLSVMVRGEPRSYWTTPAGKYDGQAAVHVGELCSSRQNFRRTGPRAAGHVDPRGGNFLDGCLYRLRDIVFPRLAASAIAPGMRHATHRAGKPNRHSSGCSKIR